ncbi:MAG: nickel-dependent lactate racemase [Anaerolineae bacterium]|nr:nickel-dependent lactate racemase [Anaerolineae bacterium]
MMYSVPFDKGVLTFDLPAGWRGTVVESKSVPPIDDVPAAIAAALANPTNSPRLRDLASPGDRVCIVFTDITRASPDYLLVPPILAELAAAGVRDDDITLLCGIGLHRPSTPEEKVAKLGREVVDRYRVVDHEPLNPEALVDLGTTDSGIPLSVNKIAYHADLLIATGIVEPHQYAGYSGARKTLAVGAAGEAMIAYTHGPHMLDHPGTRLGCIEGNPFHEAITEAARRAGLRFIVNVVQDDNKRVAYVGAGEPEATFQDLVAFARTLYEVPVPRQYDVAVAGVGYPKDANLYQASRAASYLFFGPTPVVKPGGLFIVPAPCGEGAGEGIGEQRFLKAMQKAPNVAYILDDARQHGYPPGQQRAFVMAKVLEENDVLLVGCADPALVESAKFLTAPTMEAAFEAARARLGDDLEVVIVPHSLLTLPIVQGNQVPLGPGSRTL